MNHVERTSIDHRHTQTRGWPTGPAPIHKERFGKTKGHSSPCCCLKAIRLVVDTPCEKLSKRIHLLDHGPTVPRMWQTVPHSWNRTFDRTSRHLGGKQIQLAG